MSSQILTVTIQAALFSALSTTIAQSITAYQAQQASQSPWSQFDPLSLLKFLIIAVIMTPPNYMYQRFLEDTFPSKVPVHSKEDAVGDAKKSDDGNEGKKGKEGKVKVVKGERLSKSNTLAKFLAEQSIGAMVNTAGFIVLAGIAKGRGIDVILGNDLRKDFLPMLLASWRVWPTVTLLNLVVVPFDYRPIVGNTVGLCWGTYVTLKTM